ncbi:unnamed protein product, partial [marine sediment metagenome]
MRTIYSQFIWIMLFGLFGFIANGAVAEEAGFKP